MQKTAWKISSKDKRYIAANPETGEEWTLSAFSEGRYDLREKRQGRSWSLSSGRSGWQLK